MYHEAGSRLPPRREFETINETEHQQCRSPPHIGVQVVENHARIGWRIYQLVNSRSEYQCAIHASEMPMKNQIEIMLCSSAYQKMSTRK